ncbi:IclR family transcriptional regulator domain-containing protein [Fodinicola feengrottensis]|uniref:IclR family transcriptional regulator domain-containing protein n=1 Tax=Fodinicola feengrottensis TaxID=435914 RepID=UPI00244338E5|nr:IclR family transcriptional regulator C-terminal domain-containing protein [Fodinicola feengrottensis]
MDPDRDHPPSDEVVLARYLYASALGKLLLADQPDWRAMVRDLRRFTEHTIVGRTELDTELREVAASGVARQCGELRTDRGCLAVPIRDQDTGALVAGLAVSGPTRSDRRTQHRHDRPPAQTCRPSRTAARLVS